MRVDTCDLTWTLAVARGLSRYLYSPMSCFMGFGSRVDSCGLAWTLAVSRGLLRSRVDSWTLVVARLL